MIVVFIWTVSLGPTCCLGQDFLSQFQEANRLYDLPKPTAEEDERAISLFEQIIQSQPSKENIGKLIFAHERLGNLYLVYGKSEKGVNSYRKGILLSESFQVSDSLVYQSHLYLGEALFALGKLDSSIYHLNQAEKIQASFELQAQPERLFNALGVYYFETGNYIQSISYFSQAESLLDGLEEEYARYARYSFLSNKASALYHLEKYDSARTIYQKLLHWDINTEQVFLNLANTYLKEFKPEEALMILDRIRSKSTRSSLSFQNLRSNALIQSGDLNQAEQHLLQTEKILDSLALTRKNIQKGVFLGLWGKLYFERGQGEKAVDFFHQAIVELHPNFSERDFFTNPQEFELGMASLSLFEFLAEKAKISWSLYRENREKKWFDLGKNTYQSAFELASYIGGNFDNDEARIFLGDQALDAYREAIQFLMEIDGKSNLFLAFEWAEQSKANALRLNREFQKQQKEIRIPNNFKQEERNLLYAISRVYEELFSSENPERQAQLEREYTELQVSLSRLREKQRNLLSKSDLVSSGDFNSILKQVPREVTIFSIFQGKSAVYLFKYDQGKLETKELKLSNLNLNQLGGWRAKLQSLPAGVRYQAPTVLKEFASIFLTGWNRELTKKEVLLISSHGLFSGLPFEVFPFQNGFLIEKHPIVYQFSVFQLESNELSDFELDRVLGFAPFSGEVPDFNSGLEMLYGSAEELDLFTGKRFLGKEATVKTFLDESDSARYLHLATHAKAFPDDPNASFIAFFPENQNFRLFSEELKNQNFENLELVYLSACETGGGQLRESEGTISLARSFMLAGSEQVVTTLWLTEDQVANYLSQKFYLALASGESAAEALQTAKLELLSDPEMAQFHHPAFWSNTVLIGQVDNPKDGSIWVWLIGLLGLLILGLWLVIWFRKETNINS